MVEKKIPCAAFYTFSPGNWQRDKGEVQKLMSLFQGTISELGELDNKDDLTEGSIGWQEDFSNNFQESIKKLESENPQEPKTTIWIALSCGERVEIVAAVNQAVALGKKSILKVFLLC